MSGETGSDNSRDSADPGSVIEGRYEIMRSLGHGDRKRTYLAHDQKVNRLVALSVITPEAAEFDPEGTSREAHILGHIGSHDNIVSLYDYGIDGASGNEFMVLEYLGGGTLLDYLQEKGPLPLEALLKFGRQLCRGLAHLHSKGLIHRDVSLANVWLDDRLTAHLGDFDSAVFVDEQDIRRPLTTNSFASPEELDDGPLKAQSDLFSLGLILFALATGEVDFSQAKDLRLLRRDIPTLFGDLIAALIAASPVDRPDSAEAVLLWLNDIAQISNIASLIAGGETSTVEFKSSFLNPRGPLSLGHQKKIEQGLALLEDVTREIKNDLHHAVTKTVAAFLNSEGGTLFIGVSDDGSVVGIEDDFPYLGKLRNNEDGWQQKLKEILSKAFQGDIWSAIRVSVGRLDGHLVATIHCPKRDVETWHNGANRNEEDHFYIRVTSTTEELKGSFAVAYIKQHWNWQT